MNSVSMNNRKRFNLSSVKLAIILASTLILSACGSSNIKNFAEEFDFYLLYPSTGKYCKGFENSDINKHCKSIVPTNFHSREVQVIENIYQQEITGPNRILSLMNIITKGDHLDYKPVQLDNNSYKLPKNQQTDTVWDVLIKIDRLTHLKN